jgi:type II secretory pathway pseudopilin PulG
VAAARVSWKRCAAGLALIVAVAMLVILASVLLPDVPVRVDRARQAATRNELQRLVAAIEGNPALGQERYLLDIARLPAGDSLADLVRQGSQPAFVPGLGGVYIGRSDPVHTSRGDFTGMIGHGTAGTDPTCSAPPPGKSPVAGRNGSYGTGDDLTLPDRPIQTQGELAVTARADHAVVPGTTITLDDRTVRVYVDYPVAGVETSLEMVSPGAAFGTPGRQPIPVGLRAVRAVGKDGGGLGDCTGAKRW